METNSELLAGLNAEQIQAVTHTSGPLLIVAGAGTGKTTVITKRVAYLIEQTLAQPEEILALTFTEKAAGEMEDRVDQLLPLGSYDLWISTFHSFCQRALEQYALDIGLSNDFELLDDIGQWILIQKNFEKLNLKYYRPSGSQTQIIKNLRDHFSRCKDELISPEEYTAYAESLQLNQGTAEKSGGNTDETAIEAERVGEVAHAYYVYQRALRESGNLDFGDLINCTVELFKKRPHILKKFQKQFKYIMVDEFQDTNYAQYELVKLLASTKEQNIVVVGDDDQSIYKFRGASVSNIMQLDHDFPKLKKITLLQNYRSSQNILDLAYNFIQHNNPDRLETQLGINKRLLNPTAQAGTIQVLENPDASSEIASIIEKIQLLKTGNPALTWNDFAILIRTNSQVTDITSKLEAAHIPFATSAQKGLYEKRLISDVISYLQLLDNYHESTHLYKVLQLPDFRLHPADLASLTQYSKKHNYSLYEALQHAPKLLNQEAQVASRKTIQQLLSLLQKHTALIPEQHASQLFVTILRDLGITKTLFNGTSQEAVQNREYIEQFYKKIQDFENKETNRTLRHFMEFLELEQRAGSEGDLAVDVNQGPDMVRILTVHAAKGLEFEHVFIHSVIAERFPARSRSEAIALPEPLIKDQLPSGDFHLEEERRLFYVALTRAKSGIYCTWAHDYGGKRTRKPSRFLVESKLIPGEKVKISTGKVIFTEQQLVTKQNTYLHLIPKRFSFSALKAFNNCALEYKLEHFLKLPMNGAGHLSLGVSVHNTLEQLTREYQTKKLQSQHALFSSTTAAINQNNVLIDWNHATAIYKESWINEWYENKRQAEQSYGDGLTMVKSIIELTNNTQPIIREIERSFDIPLGKYQFVGKIDRIDETPHGLVLIDYKTGKAPQRSNKNDVDQLRIYQWAHTENLLPSKINIAQLNYWYLKDGLNIVEIAPATETEMQELQERLLQTIEKIAETIMTDSFHQLHATQSKHECRYEWLEK